MTERWLPIENYPDYEISDYSRVRSHKYRSPRILSPRIDKNGYHYYGLHDGSGNCKNFKAHCLVTSAFIGPRPEGLVVRHKDGDVSNNHISNLHYGTSAENRADTQAHGTYGSKLTIRKVKIIRGLFKLGFTGLRLSEMFSVNNVTISRVIHKHTWAFVD